jgi:hypothetical protein
MYSLIEILKFIDEMKLCLEFALKYFSKGQMKFVCAAIQSKQNQVIYKGAPYKIEHGGSHL